ncbi:serine threonine protein kinase [Ilyonectria robusta]
MEEIERLREQLREEQRLREAADGGALEEQQQREEEQRRREKAEEHASASQPLTLHQYLETCHLLSLAIKVVTDRSPTTQGDTTNPAEFILYESLYGLHNRDIGSRSTARAGSAGWV